MINREKKCKLPRHWSYVERNFKRIIFKSTSSIYECCKYFVSKYWFITINKKYILRDLCFFLFFLSFFRRKKGWPSKFLLLITHFRQLPETITMKTFHWSLIMVIKSYNIDFTFLPCKDINEMFHGYDFRVIQFYTTYKQLSEVVTLKDEIGLATI